MVNKTLFKIPGNLYCDNLAKFARVTLRSVIPNLIKEFPVEIQSELSEDSKVDQWDNLKVRIMIHRSSYEEKKLKKNILLYFFVKT